MTLRAWRPVCRGSLHGFARIELPNGLWIDDVAVHVSGGRAWANLPARPMLGDDGVALRDDRGRIRYAPVLSWRDRAIAERWSDAVVALVRCAHPGDLGDAP
jgi:hypothetical protein